MDSEATVVLLEEAKKVLKANDRGKYTVPAGDLYPHQWLWDSCFISIGLRHLNLERAQTELKNLLRGQWSNGMVPNLIFSPGREYRRERELWRSYVSPYSPDKVYTTGLTQPPMLAEAVVQIGAKMKMPERRSWYKEMLSPLVAYHEWLYADRDPHQEGLIVLIHPYESGSDNSPTWISELRKHSMPWWVTLIENLHLDRAVNFVRRDTRHIPPGQRISNIEAMAQWAALRRLRRKAYNSEAILGRPYFSVEDLAFNCIFIRANRHLKKIAETAGHNLSEDLLAAMERSEKALEKLWDENNGQYYSRNFISHKLIEESSIATFMPLYTGIVTRDRAEHLLNLLRTKRRFGLSWPVPTVPADSAYFDPYKYWQGPTWINTNWLIIKGLEEYKFTKEAEMLKARTLELVQKSGLNEYFNPITGQPAGAPNFSWTAALTIDLLQQ